jgi:hypothetical protein
MRVIFNIHENNAAKAAGWRALAVHVNDKNEARLDEILKAVALKNGGAMYDYLIKDGQLNDVWELYVNGVKMTGTLNQKLKIRDNTQIHLMANQ